MIKNLIAAVVVSVITCFSIKAQTVPDEPLIITHITASGVNTINMPPQLLKLLQYNLDQETVEAEEEESADV